MANRYDLDEDEVEEFYEAPQNLKKGGFGRAKDEQTTKSQLSEWFSWVRGFLTVPSQSASKSLSWNDLFVELQASSVQNDMFDGLTFDIQKNLGMNRFALAQAQHQLKIGSASEAPSYSLTSILQSAFFGWVMARIDAEGVFMARTGWNRGGLDAKLNIQLAKEAHQNMAALDLEVPVLDAIVGLKWHMPSTIALSYFQPLSQSVHLGVEATYVGKQAFTLFSLGGKYATPLPVQPLPPSAPKKKAPPPKPTKQPPTNRSFASFNLSQSSIQFAYVKQISQIFALTSDYQIGMTQNGLDSTFTGGFDVKIQDAIRSRVTADSSLTVRSIVEESWAEMCRIILCSELDHKKQTYKVGLGLQVNI